LSGSGDDLDRLSTRINDALAQLETTVEGIRQVSVDIAHDLRTPISRLGIRLEELLAEARGQPALSQRLETASAEIRQITATFDSLLRIAQIEAGARKSRFQPVALPDIGASLYEAYLPVAEERQQRLEFKIATAAPALVHGDRDLLTQLFANLIENALKHCAAGASIRLEVGSRDGLICMSVADNGPGIPAGERRNVTRRFYRLDKSRQSPGSGLGLALVKAISDLHGAALTLDDNGPGLVVKLTFEPYRPLRTG
jgi:signal transduction histidine kinase